MTPFRVKFKGECATPLEKLKAQAALHAHLPRVQFHVNAGRLAVVGGGPSTAQHLDELRAWDGEVWGINYTAAWLIERGVDATFYTVDGDSSVPVTAPTAKRAILASMCSQETIESLRDADVRVFDVAETHLGGLTIGSSSAASAPLLALMMGYREVHFFGCEGSFVGADHVDRDEQSQHQLIVRADGVDYVTRPPYFVQCEELSTLCRELPHLFKNRSGGLLQAMIDYPDSWEVVAVSGALKQSLEQYSGANGLYDGTYVPAGVAA